MRGVRLACRASIFRPFVDDAPRLIAELRIRWIELHVPAPEHIASTVEKLALLGLRASVLQSACDLSRDDVAERVGAEMPAFEAFGCRRMLIRGAVEGVSFETAIARLGAVARVAGRHGVTVLIETHPGLAPNAETALRTIAAMTPAVVQINFDPANVEFYNHGLDPVAELTRMAPHVGGVHLKDTAGGFGEWNFPALGEGHVDFAGIIRELSRVGFAGPLTLEVDGVQGESRSVEMLVSRIQRSLDHLATLGIRP